jgi:hypothetical protein
LKFNTASSIVIAYVAESNAKHLLEPAILMHAHCRYAFY